MTHLRTVMLASFSVFLSIALPAPRDAIHALGSQQLTPQAAKQYAADSEKASRGDPDAAYRMGEALESGRLGGLKDLRKALGFYRLAAQNGNPDAASRVIQLESKLGLNRKPETSLSQGH